MPTKSAPRHADDVEDGRRQYPLRRSQRGHRASITHELSQGELERITRKFVDATHDIIGPDSDIPAPDMGTNAQVMAWFMNQYQKYHGFNPACVTGKPLELHGSEGREEATGRGVAILDGRLAATGQADGRRGHRRAFRGSATSARLPSQFLHAKGDEDRRRHRSVRRHHQPEGIEFRLCCSSAANTSDVRRIFPAGERSTNEELLTSAVDVLIPAALGGVLNKDNAQRHPGRNTSSKPPTTRPRSRPTKSSNSENLPVLPDILANAGGVTASYFEWVQNRQHFRWDLARVRTELDRILLESFEKVWKIAEDKKVSLANGGLFAGNRTRGPGHGPGRNFLSFTLVVF